MRTLVIDDEESMRHMLSVILKKEGHEVVSCPDAASALKTVEREDFDFILCDIKMPGMDGLTFLGRIASTGTRATVIMMSAYGTIDTAIECMKLGAYDYISKPFKADEIILIINKAVERERLKRENLRLVRMSRKDYDFENIHAEDPAMTELLAMVDKVSEYDSTVLITGETGTGKELVARAIHYRGKRAANPFVTVNCGAIPAQLFESEIFGHVKGAFTDAFRTRDGLFHEADGGSIFLDEVGEVPLESQVKLLRVLQEREVRRVGENKCTKVDVRVIAATVRDLASEVKLGSFREDLFYRLNVIPITVPPLRARKGDIPGLAVRFLEEYSSKFRKSIKGLSDEAMEVVLAYPWPGNVRELENVMERAVILCDNVTIGPEDLPLDASQADIQGSPEAVISDTFSIKKGGQALEIMLIKKALKASGGNKTKAAGLLEISPRALQYKIKDYGL